MSQPTIVTAAVDKIASNPYRRLHNYPYIESKITALVNSIEDVGLWPSIIARSLKDKLWQFEIAFGHHRMEAARRVGLKEVQLIVEDLTDLQMLQYMGRENLEDYDASFLIQLEAWEAALKSGLLSVRAEKVPQPFEIAKLLGWTAAHKERGGASTLVMNETARACAAAYPLIEGGYMSRDDFAAMNVRQARDVAETALQLQVKAEESAKNMSRPAREIETFKRQVGRAAADTTKQVREGSIRTREIRDHVNYNTWRRGKDRVTPLFAVAANEIARNLSRTLQSDGDAGKLASIVSVLAQIEMLEDWEALSRVRLELTNLARRAEGWEKRLTPSQEKVIHFRALEGHTEGRRP
jgi:ParB-like nuclease domain